MLVAFFALSNPRVDSRQLLALFTADVKLDVLGDVAGNVAFEPKDVAYLSIVFIGPQMLICSSPDQLHPYAHLVA